MAPLLSIADNTLAAANAGRGTILRLLVFTRMFDYRDMVCHPMPVFG